MNPLVFWIWAGGFILVLGTIVAVMKPGAVATFLKMEKDLRDRMAFPALFAAACALVLAAIAAAAGLPMAFAALGALIIGLIAFLTGRAIHALTGADRP